MRVARIMITVWKHEYWRGFMRQSWRDWRYWIRITRIPSAKGAGFQAQLGPWTIKANVTQWGAGNG